jgi:hypothetical protein
MKRWASLAMGTSGTEFLAAIRSEMRVGLIATPRANLKCHRKDRWQEVEDDPDLADFDQVPLINRAALRLRRYLSEVLVLSSYEKTCSWPRMLRLFHFWSRPIGRDFACC